MALPEAKDELAWLLGRVGRFFVAWLTLLLSLVAGWLVFGAALELVALVFLPMDWDGGEIYAHPFLLSVVWAYPALIAGCVLGAPFVLLRRHIVRPDAPFLRLGYLAVAVIPYLLFVGVADADPRWFLAPTLVQAPLLMTTLIYVALARRFRLFDTEAAGTAGL